MDICDILCDLISQHGRELSEDAARCEAILRDYCPHERGKVNVLIGALRERIVADLLSVSSVIPVELQMARLVKRMEDHLAMREDIAQWAVESWALALGVIKLPTAVVSESDEMVHIRKAADQGRADAQFNLGLRYASGQGVPQDYTEAVRWYSKAADQGMASAQFNLGLKYANGEGTPQDHAEAVKWFRMASDQGMAQAQYTLGMLYKYGLGIKQDQAEAAKWYRKAADQGHVETLKRI
jgi:hypothetical protein